MLDKDANDKCSKPKTNVAPDDSGAAFEEKLEELYQARRCSAARIRTGARAIAVGVCSALEG
jgi:hypothetical protein